MRLTERYFFLALVIFALRKYESKKQILYNYYPK